MWRHTRMRVILGGMALTFLGATSGASAQTAPKAAPPVATQTAEHRVLEALRADPVTAPFAYSAANKNGKVVLTGRVSTKEVHDAAIRIATSITASISDGLVIDTAAVARAVAVTAPAPVGPVLFGQVNSP